jgi:H+-transporting ATPase
VNTFGNPQQTRANIEELHFRPFNPVDKRTEITYRRKDTSAIERVMKGMAPVVLDLCSRQRSEEQDQLLYADVDEFARRGLRALAVGLDDSEDGKEGYRLIGLLPIYDPPREDTKRMIERAIELGIKVKMITGDQLDIAKETGRRLGSKLFTILIIVEYTFILFLVGDNMFLSTTLQGDFPKELRYRDVDDLILHADGFAGVYPEHKYEIVERLQKMGYVVAMTGDGVNDAPALSRANVGVAVADSSDAARSAADIVLTEPGLSVIIEAILGSRQIFQRMRNYAIYTCAITIRILLGFSVLVFAFKFDFPPFLVRLFYFECVYKNKQKILYLRFLF